MDQPLQALICSGRDGKTRTFWYAFERDETYPDTDIVFRVHLSNPARMTQENWFEMSLTRCPNGWWKITFIGDAERRPHYAAKGIPDALIPQASRVLKAPIRSSSKIGAKTADEFRTEDADKMWERLRVKGLARYDKIEDYYIYDASPNPNEPSVNYSI